MSMTFDISAVTRELDRLATNPHLHKLALLGRGAHRRASSADRLCGV